MRQKSRNKGKRGEREVVALARAHGLSAERTWQTAQATEAKQRRCDVLVAGLPAQVKVLAHGFGTLYAAMEGVELAFLRADHQRWLAVVDAEELLKLLALSQTDNGPLPHNP